MITADLTRLGAELEHLRGQAAWAHVDVMDGVFCPQLTVGPAFVAAVASTGIPVDAHLMVEEPRRLLPEIVAAGAAVITVHTEATRHLHRTMAEMTALAGDRTLLYPRRGHQPRYPGAGGRAGAGAGRSGPGPGGQSRLVRAGARGQHPAAGARRARAGPAGPGPTCWSAWTAGVTIANAAEIASWGIDVIVSGSAIFDRVDPAGNLNLLSATVENTPGGI